MKLCFPIAEFIPCLYYLNAKNICIYHDNGDATCEIPWRFHVQNLDESQQNCADIPIYWDALGASDTKCSVQVHDHWSVHFGFHQISRNKHPNSWWRHQMETLSALVALCARNSPVTGEFPSQRPVTWSFDVFFYLRLNKQLSKQLRRWWFETPSR